VARHIGDLITVRVIERMTIEDTQETTLERENAAALTTSQLPGNNRLPSAVGTPATGRLPGLSLSSNKEFEGEGEYQAENSATFTLSGRVIDVLENGNLVIEARRVMTFNEDRRVIRLTGICRTGDIDSTNSILSTKLHNFEVAVEGEGPLSRTQKEGWLGRVLDIVWPF